MKKTLYRNEPDQTDQSKNKAFLRSAAHLNGDGAPVVEKVQRSNFNAKNAREKAKKKSLREGLKTQLERSEAALATVYTLIASEPVNRELTNPLEEKPLTWSLLKVLGVALIALAVMLTGMGVMALNTFILDSAKLEIVTRQPWRALPLSLVVAGIVGGLKAMELILRTEPARISYLKCLMTVFLSAGVVWLLVCPLFFGEKIVDPWAEDTGAPATPATGQDWERYFYMLSAMVTEISAGGLSLIGGIMALTKRLVELNPVRKQHEENAKVLFNEVMDLRDRVGVLDGEIEALEAEEESDVLYATTDLKVLQNVLEEVKAHDARAQAEREASDRKITNIRAAFSSVGAIALAFVMLSLSPSARAEHFAAGLAEYPLDTYKTAIAPQLEQFWKVRMKRGDVLEVFSATGSFERIATIKIPEHKSYDNPNMRAKTVQSEWFKVIRWMKNTSTGFKPERLGHANFMEFSEYVAGLSPAVPGTIVLIADGRLLSGSDPRFLMGEGKLPNDAMILGSRGGSPFGTQGRENLLKAKRLHWCTFPLPAQWTTSPLTKARCQRAFSIIAQREGGALISYASDLGVVLERAALPNIKPATIYTAEVKNGAQPQMIEVHHSASWIEETVTEDAPPPVDLIGPVMVAIKWTAPVDLDLHCQADANSETLYFGHSKTADGQGIFFKDFRTSTAGRDEFEYCEYKTPIDLRKLRVNINYYEGTAPPEGVHGELRIKFQGSTFKQPFSFTASSGNGGEGSGKARLSHKHWVVIHPPSVVGKAEPRDAAEAIAQ